MHVDFGIAGRMESLSQGVSSLASTDFRVKILYPNFAETGYCEPMFDFYVRIPTPSGACADLAGGMAVKMQKDKAPKATVDVEKDPGQDCAFSFNFSLGIPCGNFSPAGTTKVSYTAPGEDPKVEIEFSLSSSLSSWSSSSSDEYVGMASGFNKECLYGFMFDFKLPQPVFDIIAIRCSSSVGGPVQPCDPNTKYVRDITGLQIIPPTGPGELPTLELSYQTANPWNQMFQFDSVYSPGSAWIGPCTIRVLTRVTTGAPIPGDCGAQVKLNFGFDDILLTWDQNVNYIDDHAQCCEKVNVVNHVVQATTGCNGQLDLYMFEHWMPRDQWSSNADYVPPNYWEEISTILYGIKDIQMIADIEIEPHDQNAACGCNNDITLIRKMFRAFPQGGLTTNIDLGLNPLTLSGLVLFFEDGLLVSSSWYSESSSG